LPQEILLPCQTPPQVYTLEETSLAVCHTDLIYSAPISLPLLHTEGSPLSWQWAPCARTNTTTDLQVGRRMFLYAVRSVSP